MTSDSIFVGIIVITLVILLLIAGIIISIFISSRREIGQKMKMSSLQLAYEKELRNAELEVREQLLSQISRELHDHVGHTLTYMHLLIENKKLDSPDLSNEFEPLGELLGQASSQLRMLSRSMNPEFLSALTFQDAVQLEVERLSRFTRMEVDYRPGTVKYNTLDRDKLLMCFRIFQEILNNTIKHSKAEHLTIRSNYSDYLLRVSDNGVGFDPDQKVASGQASGLKNMSKRASLAGMEFTITSEPGQGTVCTLSVAQH